MDVPFSKPENLASYGQDICLCLWRGSMAVSSGALVGAAGTLPRCKQTVRLMGSTNRTESLFSLVENISRLPTP